MDKVRYAGAERILDAVRMTVSPFDGALNVKWTPPILRFECEHAFTTEPAL
jgi:hypothetical protein